MMAARLTYAAVAARNVEPGDAVRFGGHHWLRVAHIADEFDGRRRAFYDQERRRTIRVPVDATMHVLDE